MMRCRWADPRSDLYVAYHDHEWGQPEHDDRKLFEMLILEGVQAGLSWLTILNKREHSALPLTTLNLPWSPSTAQKKSRH